MEMEIEVFQLTKPLSAVKFDFGRKGHCYTLPADARARVLGRSAIPGCLIVACDEQHYNIFEKDLQSHSHSRRTVRAAYACAG